MSALKKYTLHANQQKGHSSTLLKRTAACVLCAAAIVLAGCQTSMEQTAVSSGVEYWQQMQQKLGTVSHYALSGRLGMSGSTRFSANFTLQGEGDNYRLELTSPFGATIAWLKVQPGHAELFSEGKTYTAPDAQSLFYDTFNLNLPLSSLRQVVLGLIGPASILSSSGQLMSTAQDGFVVQYISFAEFSGYALPTELNVSKDKMFLKIKINEVQSIG